MSSTQLRRAATLVGTDRLLDSYVPSRGAESDLPTDFAALVLFSVIGLAISLAVALSAPLATMDVMVAALMS